MTDWRNATPPPGGLRRQGNILLWAVLAALVWLLVLDFTKVPLTPEPESSWIAVLTHASASGMRFGPQIIMTFGPLAPLVLSTYDGRIFTAGFVGELLAKGFAVLLLVRVSRWLPRRRRLAFLGVVLFVGVLSWQTFYLLALASGGLVLCGRSRGDRRWVWPTLVFTAVLALTKGGFLIGALGIMAAVTLHRWLGRAPWPRTLAPGAGFIVSIVAAWMLLGRQRIGDLPSFLWGMGEISGGYSQAMSAPPTAAALAFGLLLVALTVAQAGFLAWRSDLHWVALPRILLLAGVGFIAWKQGFVRADDHVLEWFLFAVPAAGLMPAFFDLESTRQEWMCFLIAAGLGAAAVHVQNPDTGGRFVRRLVMHAQENPSTLLDPRAWAVAEKAKVERQRREHALPLIRATVGRASVDMMGMDLALPILNGMNYTPRPVFEGYCAYTPALLRANLDFYASVRAPEFVLFKLQPIDNQLPTLEDAPVLLALARSYDPVLAEEGYLLLRRRVGAAVPTPAAFPAAWSGEVAFGETLELPAAEDGLWCELELRETFLGKLLRTVYQQPPVFLETVFAGGGPKQRRLIPGMARSGFLVSPQPGPADEFLRFAGGIAEPPLDAVRAIRLMDSPGLRRVFQPRVVYRLSRVPPPAPGAAALAEAVRGQLYRFRDVFVDQPIYVRSSAAVDRITLGGRAFLLVHATGEMGFAIPSQARRVSGQFAMAPGAWQEGKTDGVEFRIDHAPGNGEPETTLFDRYLDPAARPEDRPVQTFGIDLPPGAGGQLIFRTLPGPANNGAWDWSCWSGVRFEGPP